MSKPLFTIGLPFSHEPSDIFSRAVRSVYSQDRSDWELILVADGARPELVDLARSVKDFRVRRIIDSEHHNLATRLNQIASLATARYLVRMDADDMMTPNRLSVLLSALEQHEFDLVGSRSIVIDQDDEVLGQYKEASFPVRPVDFLRSSVFSHPTVAGNTDWFRAHPYDTSFDRAQDKELWARTAPFTRILKLDERLLFYRIVKSSLTQKSRDSSRYSRRVIQMHGERLVGRTRAGIEYHRQEVRHIIGSGMGRGGFGGAVLNRRFSVLPRDALREAQTTLNQIAMHPVPGWDA